MKCDVTREGGWFDVKGYPVIYGVGNWENPENVILGNTCYNGDGPPSKNHKAKCGMMNVFGYAYSAVDPPCYVMSIPEDENTRK